MVVIELAEDDVPEYEPKLPLHKSKEAGTAPEAIPLQTEKTNLSTAQGPAQSGGDALQDPKPQTPEVSAAIRGDETLMAARDGKCVCEFTWSEGLARVAWSRMFAPFFRHFFRLLHVWILKQRVRYLVALFYVIPLGFARLEFLKKPGSIGKKVLELLSECYQSMIVHWQVMHKKAT